ncbi:MAG: hypothetical protein RLZ63_2284 [Pseudomonadota bacterium]|jgi:quercetin dioxygenase-like cupin family protein
MTEAEFRQSTARDFDEVVLRQWPAHAVVPEHSHPFALKAMLMEGQMWLSVDGIERAIEIGETFELAHGYPHAERYGPQGAAYLVAIAR